jgi:hypothetical protein
MVLGGDERRGQVKVKGGARSEREIAGLFIGIGPHRTTTAPTVALICLYWP